MWREGKGLNQAVAARRLGAGPVYMVGSVGEDPFGEELLAFMGEEGIGAEGVGRADVPTGVALITVDAEAENTIVVAVGANSRLSAESVGTQSSLIADAGVALAQLEVPVEAVHRFLSIASGAGVTTILNTAPARPLPDALLSLVNVLCLNETELAEMAGLTGTPEERESIAAAARGLVARGAGCAIVTLGKAGALVGHCGRGHPAPGRRGGSGGPDGGGGLLSRGAGGAVERRGVAV